MNDLRDRLRELADGYASISSPPGPAAARRRGRWRRRRAVAGTVVAGMLVVGVTVGLPRALRLPGPSQPAGPSPTSVPPQAPRSTAWFRPTYVPSGFQPTNDRELSVEPLMTPPIRGAQTFRLVKGNGEFTVSVNPDLRRLDVARELRTYPVVRVVQVRGHSGLLFPRRSDNLHTGLIWEERPGVVLQVLGREGVSDQMLRDVAEGLRIVGTAGGTVKVTAGPPPGWVRAGQQVGLPTAGDYLRVLPRRHEQIFTKGPGQRRAPSFVIAEIRGRYGPLRSADKPGHVPETTRESVRVRGYPALLDHDPANHVLEVTWREPGGIELSVKADERLGRREVLAIAEGLRQP
jgi:hypothetical protein